MSRRNYDDKQELSIPRIKHWKEAVRQWEEGDPNNGLTLPLRDWDRESLRKNDTYRNRKLIVQEFDFYGRDENKMREVYGDVLNEGSDKLRKAIQARHKLEKRGFEDDQDDWQDQLHSQPIPRVWGWREAIRQWDEGDPENGLTVALCNWSREMRRSNHAYKDRRLLVGEFEYYGRDEKRMEEAYGDVLNGGTDKLKKAIQARHKLEKRGVYEDVDEEEEPQQPQAQPIPKIKHWREAIRQWEQGDPENGLTIPLREWTTPMRRERREMYDKHYKRKVIVREFDSFDRDEKRMREVYGAVMDLPISNFLKAILQRQQRLKLEAEGKKKAVARTPDKVRSESRRYLKPKASEVRQRGVNNHDEDEEDVSEDASEEAEVEAKREEDDQTLTRKRRDRSADSTQEVVKKARPTRVQLPRVQSPRVQPRRRVN